MTARFSPFVMLFGGSNDIFSETILPSTIKKLDDRFVLIDVVRKDAKIITTSIETKWNVCTCQITYDTQVGGLGVEFRVQHRPDYLDGSVNSAEELKPFESVKRSDLQKWKTTAVNRAFWTKITYEDGQDFWVPEIVEFGQIMPSRSTRTVYYFVDWKIGKQVDQSIFDHKPFEKRIPNTIYAEKQIRHEYQVRQDELDAKAAALRKKWKFE